MLLVLALALPRADNPEWLLIPVFLVLLPLANAVFDWLSLSFTRGLLHAIGHGHHTGLVALGFADFDILPALLFLFLIASLTTLLLSLLNLATGCLGRFAVAGFAIAVQWLGTGAGCVGVRLDPLYDALHPDPFPGSGIRGGVALARDLARLDST